MDSESRFSIKSLKEYYCDGIEKTRFYLNAYLIVELVFTFFPILALAILRDLAYDVGVVIATSKLILPILVVPALEICQVGLHAMFVSRRVVAITLAAIWHYFSTKWWPDGSMRSFSIMAMKERPHLRGLVWFLLFAYCLYQNIQRAAAHYHMPPVTEVPFMGLLPRTLA